MLLGLVGKRRRKRQCAALCWRERAGGIEILLITGRASGQWIIPKGWPMLARTLAQAAVQEAWEEAGVRGTVGKAPVGTYGYTKTRPASEDARIEVTVFDLQVSSEATDFPEVGQRDKSWMTPKAAAETVTNKELAAVIASFSGR